MLAILLMYKCVKKPVVSIYRSRNELLSNNLLLFQVNCTFKIWPKKLVYPVCVGELFAWIEMVFKQLAIHSCNL